MRGWPAEDRQGMATKVVAEGKLPVMLQMMDWKAVPKEKVTEAPPTRAQTPASVARQSKGVPTKLSNLWCQGVLISELSSVGN